MEGQTRFHNNAAVKIMADEFEFFAPYRRLRCTCHIINLVAQTVIWGKDRDIFENEHINLHDEEKFMTEWRNFGPLAILFDVIASISTSPQARQLFLRLQEEEAQRLGKPYAPRELVKPVKIRWNSYYDCFERALQLQGPLDECVLYNVAENKRVAHQEPRKFIKEGGLLAHDWATITEYAALLKPFKEATTCLQGRGLSGSHGAIWEVPQLPTQ